MLFVRLTFESNVICLLNTWLCTRCTIFQTRHFNLKIYSFDKGLLFLFDLPARGKGPFTVEKIQPPSLLFLPRLPPADMTRNLVGFVDPP